MKISVLKRLVYILCSAASAFNIIMFLTYISKRINLYLVVVNNINIRFESVCFARRKQRTYNMSHVECLYNYIIHAFLYINRSQLYILAKRIDSAVSIIKKLNRILNFNGLF